MFQLWWVVGGVVESLRDGGLDGTQTIKRLLGQADRELKRLYETGEPRYAETPPLDLLNNLLYYVARATTHGPRVSSVRASFKLQELLPVSEQVEQERENLSAPSVKLMQTVAAAIKEDLSRVKDVLDIFVRKGGAQVEELHAQLDMLRKIADTLGVLGLGHLRSRVQAQIQRLQDIASKRASPSDAVLVDVAATLIGVEDSLDSQLVRMIMPQAAPAGGEDHEDDGEFRHVQEAVLRECIVNLARVKETIAAVVAHQEITGADLVPQLLRGITAGLLMLGRSRAVELMEGVGRHVAQLLRPGGRLDAGRLDRLADQTKARQRNAARYNVMLAALPTGGVEPLAITPGSESAYHLYVVTLDLSRFTCTRDEFADALRLWVVQLAEGSSTALQVMFKELDTPDEVCPVLPFPSISPRRADDLLFELRQYWQAEWAETPLSFIHAHESDPMDVFRTISRLHEARRDALEGVGRPSLTILSPLGRRLPGIGMLLAALAYDLPIFYLETVGYVVTGHIDPASQDVPQHRWHFRVDEHASAR